MKPVTLSMSIAVGMFVGVAAIAGTLYGGSQIIESNRLAAAQRAVEAKRAEVRAMCDAVDAAVIDADGKHAAAIAVVKKVASEKAVPTIFTDDVEFANRYLAALMNETRTDNAVKAAGQKVQDCKENMIVAIQAIPDAR